MPKSMSLGLWSSVIIDVAGLHVPVHDALGVGVVQGRGDARGDAQLVLEGQGLAALEEASRGLPGTYSMARKGPSSLSPTS